MNQCQKILDFMNQHGGISVAEAGDFLRCFSLSRRICDLEAAGYKIKRTPQKVKNADGRIVIITVYSLQQAEQMELILT